MAFSLLAPVVAPFCAEDLYKMVMLGANNEEETSDHQKETTKKLGEKDLFLSEFASLAINDQEEESGVFGYLLMPQRIVFDIILPPPEHRL